MKTLTITLTANMAYLIQSTSNMADVVDMFTKFFEDMRDWCITQLDAGTWEMSALQTNTSSDDDLMKFSHSFTFVNDEDITAFAITFNTIPKYVCN